VNIHALHGFVHVVPPACAFAAVDDRADAFVKVQVQPASAVELEEAADVLLEKQRLAVLIVLLVRVHHLAVVAMLALQLSDMDVTQVECHAEDFVEERERRLSEPVNVLRAPRDLLLDAIDFDDFLIVDLIERELPQFHVAVLPDSQGRALQSFHHERSVRVPDSRRHARWLEKHRQDQRRHQPQHGAEDNGTQHATPRV